jgi:hypothetical protein
MTPNCTQRSFSNVALQSLMLMNSDFIVEYSGRLAARVQAEVGKDAGAQVRRAWQLAYGSAAGPEVVRELLEFLGRQEQAFARLSKKPDAAGARRQAMSSLCQGLISANRFLYVD